MPEKTLNCPSCAAPLEIASRFTQIVVCQYCAQTSEVRDNSLDPTGKSAKLTDYGSRLSVGKSGALAGRRFDILGRVRYQYDDGVWDEWFLKFDDGQPAWLSEDEGEYVLYSKRRLTSEVPPWEQLRVGAKLDIPPHSVFVTEKGSGGVVGAEGELAMAASPGASLRYVDGNAAGKVIMLMYTDSAINFGVGQPYEFHDVVVHS